MDCKHCGIIYRSRQHWYGNKEPELDAVRTENRHVWPEVRKIQHCYCDIINASFVHFIRIFLEEICPTTQPVASLMALVI